MWERGIKPKLIITANVGSERPETYTFRPIFDDWLESVGFPRSVTVRYQPQDYKHWPPYYTLLENCLTNVTLLRCPRWHTVITRAQRNGKSAQSTNTYRAFHGHENGGQKAERSSRRLALTIHPTNTARLKGAVQPSQSRAMRRTNTTSLSHSRNGVGPGRNASRQSRELGCRCHQSPAATFVRR
jgi:hypothetical protein